MKFSPKFPGIECVKFVLIFLRPKCNIVGFMIVAFCFHNSAYAGSIGGLYGGVDYMLVDWSNISSSGDSVVLTRTRTTNDTTMVNTGSGSGLTTLNFGTQLSGYAIEGQTATTTTQSNQEKQVGYSPASGIGLKAGYEMYSKHFFGEIGFLRISRQGKGDLSSSVMDHIDNEVSFHIGHVFRTGEISNFSVSGFGLINSIVVDAQKLFDSDQININSFSFSYGFSAKINIFLTESMRFGASLRWAPVIETSLSDGGASSSSGSVPSLQITDLPSNALSQARKRVVETSDQFSVIGGILRSGGLKLIVSLDSF